METNTTASSPGKTLEIIRNTLQEKPGDTSPLIRVADMKRQTDLTDDFLFDALRKRFTMPGYTKAEITEALDSADYINVELAGETLIPLADIKNKAWQQSHFRFTVNAAQTFGRLLETILQKTELLNVMHIKREPLLEQFNAEHIITMALLRHKASAIMYADPGLYFDPVILAQIRIAFPQSAIPFGTFKAITQRFNTRQHLLPDVLAMRTDPALKSLTISQLITAFWQRQAETARRN